MRSPFFWLLKKSSQWFSLFFIPLIPFGSKHFMQCPICGEAEHLSKEQFEAKEKDAELKNQLLQGTINEDEYHKQKNSTLWLNRKPMNMLRFMLAM